MKTKKTKISESLFVCVMPTVIGDAVRTTLSELGVKETNRNLKDALEHFLYVDRGHDGLPGVEELDIDQDGHDDEGSRIFIVAKMKGFLIESRFGFCVTD